MWYNKYICKDFNAVRVVGAAEHREPRGAESAEFVSDEVRLYEALQRRFGRRGEIAVSVPVFRVKEQRGATVSSEAKWNRV